VEIRFTLAEDPASGVFSFASEDWSLVELCGTLRGALNSSSMPLPATLGLERTLHRLQSGRVLACTRPVIALAGL
jgi:hypothetical protein